ncbi:hypothetical protein C0993_004840 [Termitomyces sp. T159_Od127]|nr:hypothetical protein C0993_004840 [Termitomyces sp. T159_Od127]
MDYPESPIVPFDITTVVIPGDEIPAELNTSEIAFGAAFYHNGVTHSFFSKPVSMGQDGKGWASIEEVLVRLNTTYTPNGTFASKSDQSPPDAQGNPTWFGYDAAVCVELFEPWIVEIYNSTTGLPTTLRIVQQGNVAQDTPEVQERLVGLPLSVTNPDAHQTLNSSRLYDVYVNAHQNSVNQLVKDNGRDLWYVPSPTVRSLSSIVAALLTAIWLSRWSLSPEDKVSMATGSYLLPILPRLADSRMLVTCSHISQGGEILTRRYQDLVLSSTSVNRIYMGIYIGLILLLGVSAGCFVPKLPLNVPHRGFDVYSWIAAFHADELIETGGTPENRVGIEKNMDLHEIVQQIGDIKFRLIT